MRKLTYVGPHNPGVDVVLPDGRVRFVGNGETESFPSEVAKSLLDQGKENWIEAKPEHKKPEAKADNDENPEGVN